MPQAYIIIFLLFFAVLAFAWFYFQRAKARTAPPSTTTDAPSTEHVHTEDADHSH